MASSDKVEQQLDFWRPFSWSAVIFGAVLALALSTMLHILGVGVAATVVDPADQFSNNLLTLGGWSGIWFILSTAAGLFVGGFVAASISRTFSDERAAIYGLGVWAISALITIAIASSSLATATGNVIAATGNLAGNTLQAAGNATQSIASGGYQIAQNVLPNNTLQQIEQTLRGDAQGQINAQGAQQIFNVLQQAARQGEWTQQQTQQLEQAVATTFNIPIEEAQQRVQSAVPQINQAINEVRETARQAAEAALTAIEATMYWSFAAILVGLIAALIGARFGVIDEKDLPRFARLSLRSTQMRRA